MELHPTSTPTDQHDPNSGNFDGPFFTLICPLYNVAPYLPDFFDSLETQTFGINKLEIILVDDGSDDGQTPTLAKQFAKLHPDTVRYIRQANGGQASARNTGLQYATGVWLTFPDPDDRLDQEYFARIHEALENSDTTEVAVASARIVMWHPELNLPLQDRHALGHRFHQGETLRDLRISPEWIQPHATSGFVRRSTVFSSAIRFPEELRYRFEDGHFMAEYLLRSNRPTIIFVPAANYHYRQRTDRSSTIQISRSHPETYVDTIRIGFKSLLSIALEVHGEIPRWLQLLLLYDQLWVLRASNGGSLYRTDFSSSVRTDLKNLIDEYIQYIDEESIRDFSLMPIEQWMRDLLLAIKSKNSVLTLYLGAHDARQGLQSYFYHFAGSVPNEKIFLDGKISSPHFEKLSGLEYTGFILGWRRTIWLPDDTPVSIRLNHQEYKPQLPRHAAPAKFGSDKGPSHMKRWRHLVICGLQSTRVKRIAGAIRRRFTRSGIEYFKQDLVIRLGLYRRRFQKSWVFIDRDTSANDSAEDLYRWVRNHHPDVNIWFLLRKNSYDWDRLQAEGFKLLPYGSLKHWAALANAEQYASSHADRFITHSVPAKVRRQYKFTFLQHGIIKGDISAWLNPKAIDVFITSTEDEYAYVSGTSPFRFSPKEVRLTGLPRHDALLELQRSQQPGSQKKVLIMPTWREYLVGEMSDTSTNRSRVTRFSESTFFSHWQALMFSDSFRELMRSGNCEFVFMPHPNLHPYLQEFDLPDWIEVASYEDTDVRLLLVQADLLITDYSSMAFNAAYLRVPTIYFQFDRDEYLAGHTERPGYFSYEDQGFGPVCDSTETVLAAVEASLAGRLPKKYAQRMTLTFPLRDGNNSERVFNAMKRSLIKAPLQTRSSRAKLDSWFEVE